MPELMYYCPQIWCSDDTDAHERNLYSSMVQVSSIQLQQQVLVFPQVPNHQTGRITSIETRGVVAMAGSFGYELDLNQLSEEEKTVVAKQVTHYKEISKFDL